MLIGLLLTVSANAHEIRPAYLEIQQDSAQGVKILWKQPVIGDVALPIQPLLSAGWLDPNAATTTYSDSYLIRRWQIDAPAVSLQSQTLTIAGLQQSLTDVLVRVVIDGEENSYLIKPESPTLVFSAAQKSLLSVFGYFAVGIEHIWTGVDHLLFVFGLMLLAARFTDLVKTITAFTVAHSITLAAAVLGLLQVASAPVEAVIALSIVYLAVELVYQRRGRHGFVHRFPWLVAFIFGLLHGFGFAGALNEVGLPRDSISTVLLFFNIGIELGQIAFVAMVLILLKLLSKTIPLIQTQVRLVTPHVIGSLAAFWFIERTILAFS